ncbi:MAG: SDR family NAD(P)-dependent oxidoreductase [Planctomycetota bacterium]
MLRGVAAGRIAYVFGLQGPTLQVDTTCSSSLVAVHLARQALLSGEADMAIAGGVNLMLSPDPTIACCKMRALSASGRCRTFSDSADGYVRGEGCCVIVLQKLSDAIASGRQVYAVISGSAMNHDGRSNGLTAPHLPSQVSVIQSALRSANLDPDQVDYVEAHGTGTDLGDPIEAKALQEVFGSRRDPLLVGSVKTNIGHLEAAAGIAGLAKCILAMQQAEIPRHLNCERLSGRIDWSDSVLEVTRQAFPWPEKDGTRRAGVSSFGLSGTNAHVIVERPVEVASIDVSKPFNGDEEYKTPFNQKRYWLPAPDITLPQGESSCKLGEGFAGNPSPPAAAYDSPASKIQLARTRLHQLSIAGESLQCFAGELLQADWNDHRIDGNVLLPATGFLWLTGSAFRSICGDEWQIDSMRLLQALWLEEEQVEIQVQFSAPNDRTHVFAFYSHRNGEWIKHAEGNIRATGRLHNGSFVARKSSHDKELHLSADGFYRAFAGHHLEYGESFQLISAVHLKQDFASAEIELLRLDPSQPAALWDAGLQLAGALLAGPAIRETTHTAYVPVAIGSFRGELNLPDSLSEVKIQAELRDETINVTWLAGEKVIAKLEGLGLAPLNIGSLSSNDDRRELFEINWTASPLAGATQTVDRIDSFDLITHDQSAEPHFQSFGDVALLVVPRLDGSTPDRVSEKMACSVLGAIQRWDKHESPRRFYVISEQRTAEDDLAASCLWGLLQTVALEIPALRCTWIATDDLDAAKREIEADDPATRVRIRSGAREIASIHSVAPEPACPPRFEGVITIQLKPNNGTLSDIEWVHAERRAPTVNEVEIEVHATGLNFRDILVAMDLYPTQAELGCECAGVITRVGPNVDQLSVGDRVAAIGPTCFADFVITDHRLTVKLSDGQSFVDAAAMPVAFCTAQHALVGLAKLQKGESVLIHAGTGGVGQAAIRIAQSAGAQVYASASRRKWKVLSELGIAQPIDSRSLDFADQLLRATSNRGVDVVLNSLAGDFRRRNLDVLAEGGRFIEIGKGEGITADEIGSLRPDVQHHLFDLSDFSAKQPQQVQSLLQSLMEHSSEWQSGTTAVRHFSRDKVHDAFRLMQSTQHVGKLVIENKRKTGVVLITGGLGALGMFTANWLIERGIQHVALLVRHGIRNDEQRKSIERLRDQGVMVEIFEADVADRLAVQRSINLIRQADNRRLVGVVHAAGSLADAPIESQSPETLRHTFAAKVTGAWNLHELTKDDPLEFFALYSSAAGVFGSPGQANHAAANSFLDQLARYRVERGLPALSLAWGPWSEIGSAIAYEKDGRLKAMPGIKTIAPAEAAGHLDHLWSSDRPTVAILPIDWDRFETNQWDGFADAFGNRLMQLSTRAAIPRAGSSQLDPHRPLEADSPRGRVTLENWTTSAREGEIRRSQTLPAPISPAELQRIIVERVATVLGFQPERLDRDKGFFELGLDSLTAIELKNQMQRQLGISLPDTALFDFPTTNSLIDFLSTQITPGSSGTESESNIGDQLDQKLDEIEGLLG